MNIKDVPRALGINKTGEMSRNKAYVVDIEDMDEFGKVYMSTVGCGIVYGKLSGSEKPPVTNTTTTVTSTTTTTTSKTTSSATSTTTTSNIIIEYRYPGDANCDGKVDLADAILILQALANPNKYGIGGTAPDHLTVQGKENADCSGGSDGMTANDALAIQKYLIKLIPSLPEE